MTDDSVAVIVERIEGIKAQVSQLDKKVDERHSRAESWRVHFDEKLDKRPCISHAKFISSVAIQLKGIWFLIGVLLTAAIMEFIKK